MNRDFSCRSRFETLMTELLQGQEAALDAIKHLPSWMKRQRRALDITQYPLASAYVMPQPLGVIGIVVPWNFPIGMAVQPMIAALAAGNRVMVKMSENSAHLARLLQSLLPRYFAADKVSLFQDAGEDGQSVGPLFTQLPFNHLFFTGSPQTGKAVMANCAANLTPVTLELGGKSPAIVAPDYPLDTAAERIMWVKMLNAGQICTNVDYLFVPEGQEQAFISHAQKILAQRYPDLLNGDYTAIIDQRQYERLQAMLADAMAQGAQAVPLMPGHAGDPARRIMAPIALLNVHDGMQVMQREIFGPLLPIRAYRQKEDVVQYINDRPTRWRCTCSATSAACKTITSARHCRAASRSTTRCCTPGSTACPLAAWARAAWALPRARGLPDLLQAAPGVSARAAAHGGLFAASRMADWPARC